MKIQHSFLPNPPARMKDKLVPPKGNVVVGKPIPKFKQVLGTTTQNSVPRVHFKKPVRSGPKLVRVKVPNPTFESEKISHDKLRAMADLENDIGEVIDGEFERWMPETKIFLCRSNRISR